MQTVHKVADTPLGFKELKRMLGPDIDHVNFYLYSELQDLNYTQFMNKTCCIVLIHKKDSANPVGHFFAVMDHGKKLEHFDPYGYDLKHLYEITKQEPYLSKLYKQSNKSLQVNKFKFQSLQDDIETCGRWCVARIKLKDKSLKTFFQFFKEIVNNPDLKVSLMTYFL